MTPTEFMRLGDKEIVRAVEEAWKPEISIKEIMKKIVPRSINNGYSKIGKGLCISVFYIENDEENNTIDLIYLEEKVIRRKCDSRQKNCQISEHIKY